jgi:hypothetical protein
MGTYPKAGKAGVRQGGHRMGFTVGPSNEGGTSSGWPATGLLIAAIAVLTGLGLTPFTVFDLIVLAAVSAAITTASVLVVRRVRRFSAPARPRADETPLGVQGQPAAAPEVRPGRALVPPEADIEVIRLGDYEPAVTAPEP